MAKLGVYYALCPLIENRSLVGLSRDAEDGVVVVTLGRNIAIKYKLSDQKQLHSWRTKEKFTSSIIYDETEKRYVGVFNQSYIRVWTGNEEFLDKLKKYKFNKQIYTIFVCNGRSFILFKNGALKPLNEALEARKNLVLEDVIDDTAHIIDVIYTSLEQDVYVGLIVGSENRTYLYWTKLNTSGREQPLTKLNLQRDKNPKLNGYVLHTDRDLVNFVSLWSDGKIFSCPLRNSDLDSTTIGGLLTTVESISCQHYVSMVSLDENYIAMYGANCNEEGALLIIFNVQFTLTQSKQLFKMFTQGAKLWLVGNSLLLPVAQNLAVVPFHLDTEQLAALVGSHKIVDTDPDVSIVQTVQTGSWDTEIAKSKDNIPKDVRMKIFEPLDQGLPEGLTIEILLPDLVKKKDVTSLSGIIRNISDISEQCLVELLGVFLNFDDSLFKKSAKNPSKLCPPNLQLVRKAALINLILVKGFSEVLILSHLRSKLSVDHALVLLQYICFLLSQEGPVSLPPLDPVQTEAKLIEWGCAILDAHYQKILLTRDDKVKEVLSMFSTLVEEELSGMNYMTEVAPLLREVCSGKSINKSASRSTNYSIEELTLY